MDGDGGAGTGGTGECDYPLAAPNWLLQSTSSDGLVRLHNHGSEDVRYDPYYTRFAYSTVTRPLDAPPDNVVTVGGDPRREGIVPLGVGEDWAASRYVLSSGAEVASLVVAEGAVEVRAHLVAGAEPGTEVHVTGWAPVEGGDARAELVPVHGLAGTSPCRVCSAKALRRSSSRWPASRPSPTPCPCGNWCPWRCRGCRPTAFTARTT